MTFKKPVTELITDRVSTRTFDNREISNSVRDELNAFIAGINSQKSFNGRFLLLENSEPGDGTSRKPGTYGMIAGAHSFLVMILKKDAADAATAGFLFEEIILCAADLGLQTCWLGGSFNKNDFKNRVSLAENEYIPIVSPVGYMKSKPRALESVMRTAIGANKRKPWKDLFFDSQQNPLDQQSAGRYATALEMVRLGPSASNKQPWRVILADDAFHFYLCRTPGYGLPSYDLQKNDLGIARCHFELTANELGLSGSWQQLSFNLPASDWEYISSWVASEK
jgi:nitroreductase